MKHEPRRTPTEYATEHLVKALLKLEKHGELPEIQAALRALLKLI